MCAVVFEFSFLSFLYVLSLGSWFITKHNPSHSHVLYWFTVLICSTIPETLKCFYEGRKRQKHSLRDSQSSIIWCNCLPDIRGWFNRNINQWSWPHCTSSSVISGLSLQSCNVCLKMQKFDSCLHFNLHIAKLVQSCFFNPGNIRKIRSILSSQDTEKLIHAFVTSHLDYCNALFTWLAQSSLKCLQLKQSSATRLLNKTRHYANICPACVYFIFQQWCILEKVLNH